MRLGILLAAGVSVFVAKVTQGYAQENLEDIPLTHDALSQLTTEQVARRVLGPAADIVTDMRPEFHWFFFRYQLDYAHFFTRPRASEPGLCQRTEITVSFETEDCMEGDSQDTNLKMRIANIVSEPRYYAMGPFDRPMGTRQKEALEVGCAGLEWSVPFFESESAYAASEGAYLLDVALGGTMPRGERPEPEIACNMREEDCADLNERFTTLTPRHVTDISSGCRPPQKSTICYSMTIEASGTRYWSVYIEAERGSAVNILTIRKARFELNYQPVY